MDALAWLIVPVIGLLAYRQLKNNPRGIAMRPNKVSDSGRVFITKREGKRSTMYLDEADIPTIGVGHLIKDDEPQLLTATLTDRQIDDLLKQDLAIAEKAVNENVAVMQSLSQNEFDAMASLVFNIGTSAFKESTLLKKFNEGDKQGAANEFNRWVYITDPNTGKKVISFGLQNRREAERALFLS